MYAYAPPLEQDVVAKALKERGDLLSAFVPSTSARGRTRVRGASRSRAHSKSKATRARSSRSGIGADIRRARSLEVALGMSAARGVSDGLAASPRREVPAPRGEPRAPTSPLAGSPHTPLSYSAAGSESRRFREENSLYLPRTTLDVLTPERRMQLRSAAASLAPLARASAAASSGAPRAAPPASAAAAQPLSPDAGHVERGASRRATSI